MNGDRALGEKLSISIGTAIPLEILLEEKTSLHYNFLYMNLATLHRNFYDSYPAGQIPAFKTYLKLFIEEVQVIQSIVVDTIQGIILPVLYIATGKSIKIKMPHANVKYPTTTLQITYDELERAVINGTLKKLGMGTIQVYDILIKGNNVTALMLTHHALDLMSRASFRKLDLLESHTGLIKTKSQWITKLSKSDIYRNLPFNIFTIQILGDRSKQFSAINSRTLKVVLDLAKTNKWSAATTLEKVKYDLRKIPDAALSAKLLEMAMVKLV